MNYPARKIENENRNPPSLQMVKDPGKPGWIQNWNPEDPEFWRTTGKIIAQRNLVISLSALFLAFVVWMVWSTIVIELPSVGFKFTTDQLFWLAALPGLSGATLRIFYAFMVPIYGGRNFTVASTASLLIPMAGIGFAVQNPETPYSVFLALALLCGFGGGNFASSMSNISFFYPKALKGTALGLNGGLGNLGVSAVQFLTPWVIAIGLFGNMGGQPQAWAKEGISKSIWLQNTAWVWVPAIVAVTIAAWFGMSNLTSAKASFKEQSVIFRRKHNWLTSLLYLGTFGSFIGYSAALPLLIKTSFPLMSPLKYAFIGPLLGALARSVGGVLADKVGGARVTFFSFATMTFAAAGVLYFLGVKEEPYAFTGFLSMFILLFLMSGFGNASTYRMVPVIFTKLFPEQAVKESAAVLGFISAVAAYGAFIIPKTFGFAMAKTGSFQAAFMGFIVYYLICMGITFWYYARKNAEASC